VAYAGYGNYTEAETNFNKAKEIARFREENEAISAPQFKKLVNESVGGFSQKKEEEFQKGMKIVEAKEAIKGKFLRDGYVWMLAQTVMSAGSPVYPSSVAGRVRNTGKRDTSGTTVQFPGGFGTVVFGAVSSGYCLVQLQGLC
jgi:hypothetical protein